MFLPTSISRHDNQRIFHNGIQRDQRTRGRVGVLRIMALNTLHNVTLSEAQISIILYTLEDYMSSDRKSNDPDLENDVDSIFEELEGTIDRHYDKIEKARKKQPDMEW